MVAGRRGRGRRRRACRPQQGIGLEGPGLIIFATAIAALVLLDIGYMRGRWGFFLDCAVGLPACSAWSAAAALAFRGWELWSVGYLPLPQQSPGLALAVVGVALVLYGAGIGFAVPRRVLALSRARAGSAGEIRIQATTTATSSHSRISIGRRSGR